MRARILITCLALTVASLVLHQPVEAQGPGKAPGKAKAKAGPVKRRADGKPELQGFWETRVFFTAFDLEAHPTATFEIPAGPGVVVDPPDGKLPYLPAAMQHRKEMESRLAEDPQSHCYLSGVPRQMYTPFGFQILQPSGAFLLNFEAFHAYRMIHMSGKHPDPAIKLFEGDSRGHWEGDTLVVDTTNLNDRTWFDMAANFHSDQLHVVERFTPVDSNTIRYQATLTDPKTFSQPVKIAFDLGRNLEPGYETLEYACVEGEQDLQHYTASVGGAAQDK